MYVHSEEKIHGCVNGVSQCLQTCLGAKRHALRLCKYVSASPSVPEAAYLYDDPYTFRTNFVCSPLFEKRPKIT